MSINTTDTPRIYLDYAAATPLLPEVYDAMLPYLTEIYGNPSAIHAEGRKARAAIDAARASVARTMRIKESGVVFTGNGTESNNLAIRGVIMAAHNRGAAYTDLEVISTPIEHPSVLKTLRSVERLGVTVRWVAVSEEGRIDIKHLEELISEKTTLFTCAYVNSEIGVVQDVKRVARLLRTKRQAHATSCLFHLDASQAPLWLPCQMDSLGVDLMTLDAGKCGGPKGVGLLLGRHGLSLTPQLTGGGQEGGLRAGTENTAGIVGASVALVHAQTGWESRSASVSQVRDVLIASLMDRINGAVLNGSHEHRVANNVNISIPGLDTEYAVVTLDHHGIAAGTKSACSGLEDAGSEVVRTVTGDDTRARATIRFTLGPDTTEADVAQAVAILGVHCDRMRPYQSVK